MSHASTAGIAALTICALLLPTRVAHAQDAPGPTIQRASPRGPGAVGKGAIIGAVVALGFTAAAANAYGENEGGRFCGACLTQWSTVTVPAGAAIGAGVGALISAVRRRPAINGGRGRHLDGMPVFVRGGAGVLLRARF